MGGFFFSMTIQSGQNSLQKGFRLLHTVFKGHVDGAEGGMLAEVIWGDMRDSSATSDAVIVWRLDGFPTGQSQPSEACSAAIGSG